MSSCSSHSHSPAQQAALPIISVNGVVIDETLLANELQYHQNANFDTVVQQSAQALVIKELLVQQAKKVGMDVTAENEEQQVQKLLEDNVHYDDPTEEICERYFANNPQKFIGTPLMEVEHILLAAAKDDITGRRDAKQQAKDIISQLQQDPMLFPALAEEYSACPSKKSGGSLGQISKGQTVPEFERQLAPMSQGLALNPVESRYGVHVVNIAHKVEGRPLEYSMVADKVKGYLVHRASRLAIQHYLHSLVESSDIEGVEIQFADENVHI